MGISFLLSVILLNGKVFPAGSTRNSLCETLKTSVNTFTLAGQSSLQTMWSSNITQQNQFTTDIWNFPKYNSGAFWGNCIYPNAVCCSGERWEPYLTTESGYGNAIVKIDSLNRLHFEFLQETALSDSTIPIPVDFFVGSEASNSLGYDSIIVLQGVYQVNFSNFPQYGEVTFNTRLVSSAIPKIKLTVIPEGFLYAASINTTRSNIKDKSSISLHSSTSPYSIIDIDTVEIDSVTLSGVCFFNNALPGSYYVTVQHRNSLEVWSSNPVYVTENLTSYDFTSASSKAYGNNMVLKFGKWCTYSGDVNQDGTIDAGDLSPVENAASIGLSGYVAADVNGDDFVDGSDLSIVENNKDLGVTLITP